MADTLTTWVGTGIIGTAFTSVAYFISRRDQQRKDRELSDANERRDREIEASNRVAEALAFRDSALTRLNDLETWKAHAEPQITALLSDKLGLEAKVLRLTEQIADMTVQLAAYEKQANEYRIEINALNEMLANKKGELEAAMKRLDDYKSAIARGEVITHAMLYQKTSEGTETAIVTGGGGELL